VEKAGKKTGMMTGLVFGKFMPLHKGHLALIDFAASHCDKLYVVLCYTMQEPIDGVTRKEWLIKSLNEYSNVTLIPFAYDETILPNTSVSLREVSAAWATAFKQLVPDVMVVFTSEKYGDYIAEYLDIRHVMFDEHRLNIPVSANAIRKDPFLYWNLIADAAKPLFVKKVAIVGTESTGKTILTERLAAHFNTSYVPEMARQIIEETETCTLDHLYQVASLHAKTILEKLTDANKILFSDTDILITSSYAEFLFGHTLQVEPWITEANRFDLYLFLEPDCEYIQDGTRLSREKREELSRHHKQFFSKAGVNYISIDSTDWQERFDSAVDCINTAFPDLAASR
jgi:HTH-type transcriptional regulator, transcriptional repressor of NAD biosynthesis genes